MDVAIYARLSKKRKNPDNPEGLSENVEIQMAECRRYAEAQGWTVVEVFKDDDRSASKFSKKPRAEYELLLQAVRDNRVEVILCTEISRLYRRMEELLELINIATLTRLKLIVSTDGTSHNLMTPQGVYEAMGAVGYTILESSRLSERLQRKKAVQAKTGRPSGGHRGFGYNDKGMEFLEPERTYLHEAGMRYIAGDTVKQIVVDYNARGIVTTEGKPLTIENFQRTLFNKRNVGIRVHNGAEYPASWPAIFTAEEYAKMDARRWSRAARWPGRGRGVGRKYLLTGLCFCGRCGAYMVGRRRQIGGGYQRRYVCRAEDNYGQKVGCGGVFRGADPLEAWITEAVLYRFETPEIAVALAEPEDTDKTDELVSAFKEAKDHVEQINTDYGMKLMSRDSWIIANRAAEAALESARAALAKHQSRTAMVLPAPELMRQTWATASLEWRHDVVKLLVARIDVLPGHPGSATWRGWRFQPDLISVAWRA